MWKRRKGREYLLECVSIYLFVCVPACVFKILLVLNAADKLILSRYSLVLVAKQFQSFNSTHIPAIWIWGDTVNLTNVIVMIAYQQS